MCVNIKIFKTKRTYFLYMTEYTELFEITLTNPMDKAEEIEEFSSAVQDIKDVYGVLEISTPTVSVKNVPIKSFKVDITYDTHHTDRTVLAQNIEELAHFEEVTFA